MNILNDLKSRYVKIQQTMSEIVILVKESQNELVKEKLVDYLSDIEYVRTTFKQIMVLNDLNTDQQNKIAFMLSQCDKNKIMAQRLLLLLNLGLQF